MQAGSIVIDFTTNTANATSGIGDVNKSLDQFGHKSHETAGAADGLFKNFVGAELLVGAIEKVGEAAMEAGRKIAELVAQTVEEDVQTSRLAATLGITAGSLQGLQVAAKLGAGMDPETLAKGIEHMAAALGDAAAKGGPAANALEYMGLNATKLANQPLDKSFLQVVDALSQIGNVSERLKLADDIFGARQAKEMAPLLSKNKEEIRAYIREGEKSGNVLSNVDNSKVLAAGEAAEKLELRFKGVVQQLTVALAPAITTVANKIGDLIPAAGSMQSGFGSAIQVIGHGFGYLLDGYQLLKIGVLSMATVSVAGLEGIAIAAEKVAEAIVWLANKAGANISTPKWMTDFKDGLDFARKDLEKQALDAAKAPWAHIEFNKGVDKALAPPPAPPPTAPTVSTPAGGFKAFEDLKKAQAEVAKSTAELQKEIDTFSMSASDKKIYELQQQFKDLAPALQPNIDKVKELAHHLDDLEKHKKVSDAIKQLQEDVNSGGDEHTKKLQALTDEGATTKEIAQYKELSRMLEDQKQQHKDLEEAKKLAEEALTPAQKYNEEMEKLNKLLREGAINQDIFNKAKKKIGNDLDKADESETKYSGATERRFDAYLPGNTTNPSDDFHNKSLDNQGKSLDLQKQQGDWVRDLWNKIVNKAGGVSDESSMIDAFA